MRSMRTGLQRPKGVLTEEEENFFVQMRGRIIANIHQFVVLYTSICSVM